MQIAIMTAFGSSAGLKCGPILELARCFRRHHFSGPEECGSEARIGMVSREPGCICDKMISESERKQSDRFHST